MMTVYASNNVMLTICGQMFTHEGPDGSDAYAEVIAVNIHCAKRHYVSTT